MPSYSTSRTRPPTTQPLGKWPHTMYARLLCGPPTWPLTVSWAPSARSRPGRRRDHVTPRTWRVTGPSRRHCSTSGTGLWRHHHLEEEKGQEEVEDPCWKRTRACHRCLHSTWTSMSFYCWVSPTRPRWSADRLCNNNNNNNNNNNKYV